MLERSMDVVDASFLPDSGWPIFQFITCPLFPIQGWSDEDIASQQSVYILLACRQGGGLREAHLICPKPRGPDCLLPPDITPALPVCSSMAPRRPRPKISLWARFRYWLRHLESPLRLRASYIRLSHQNKYPLLALLRMFIPYPTCSFPIPGPYSPRELIEDTKNKTGIIDSHFGEIHNLRAIPVWRMRDTPLRSVYRLYELHLADHYALMGWETEYFFFRPDWMLKDIPDPKDQIRFGMQWSLRSWKSCMRL